MIRQTTRFMGEILTALGFLTRLPLVTVSRTLGQRMGLPGEAVAAFPVAGLILGAVLAGLDAVLGLTRLPAISRDVVLVVAQVWLTGGLHLDGLMDTCDGLLGGRSVEQRLAIMHDSRVGSFGVLGGVCVLLLKVGMLAALPGGHARIAVLLIAPLLGRWALVVAAALFPPARPDGLGAAFRAGMTRPRLVVATAITTVLSVAIDGGTGLLAMAACLATTWWLGRAITARIAGLTGDSYGTMAEVNEVMVMSVLALVGGG